jgi:CheY-like chemotaxis protein
VLLVEDNDINALLARRMLEKAGCDVQVRGNGREAVDAIQRRLAGPDPPFDVVFMDVHMPVLDGLEATRIIKGLYAAQPDAGLRAPPIVALTANAFEEDRRRCIDAGMDDYPAKPFDREDLQQVLGSGVAPAPLFKRPEQSATIVAFSVGSAFLSIAARSVRLRRLALAVFGDCHASCGDDCRVDGAGLRGPGGVAGREDLCGAQREL